MSNPLVVKRYGGLFDRLPEPDTVFLADFGWGDRQHYTVAHTVTPVDLIGWLTRCRRCGCDHRFSTWGLRFLPERRCPTCVAIILGERRPEAARPKGEKPTAGRPRVSGNSEAKYL